MIGIRSTVLIQSPVHSPVLSIIRSTFIFSAALGLSACFDIGGGGGGGSQGGGTNPSVAAKAVLIDPGDADCPHGGALVETGIDENANGVLDASEVDASEKVCNGAPGPEGPQGEPGADAPDRTAELCELYGLTGNPLPAFCPPLPPRIVFVSSQGYTSNLDGVSGADAKCQAAAGNAGLTGTFRAWIATNSTDAPATRFTKSGAPYERTDGVTVAQNWNDLTDGSLAAPINVDENGVVIGSFAWTNVNPDGQVRDTNTFYQCDGWDSFSFSLGNNGKTDAVDTQWTVSLVGPYPCDLGGLHLYCFQQ